MSIRQIKLVCLLGVFCIAAEKPPRIVAAEPLPIAKPESVGVSSRRLDQIGVALRAEIARNTMPGAVVAVARRGKLVYYEAFGKLGDPAGSPMPKNAIFPIFSMRRHSSSSIKPTPGYSGEASQTQDWMRNGYTKGLVSYGGNRRIFRP